MPTLAQRLSSRFRGIEGVIESDSVFQSGPAFWVNGKEVAHLDDGGVLDLRLTRHVIRERRSELRSDPRVGLRRSGSDWVEVTFETMADVEFAVGLMEAAVAAHRAPAGALGSPPPTGAELARRRRFH